MTTDDQPTGTGASGDAVERQLDTLGVAVRSAAEGHRGDLVALEQRQRSQRRRQLAVVGVLLIALVATTALAISRRSPTQSVDSAGSSALPSTPNSTTRSVGDCATTGGFSTKTIQAPTVVGAFKFVLVGEPTFLRWVGDEPRCHREAEVQPMEPDRPLVGLLTAHHRDSSRQLDFPLGMDAMLMGLGTEGQLGNTVQRQINPSDPPDQHVCAVEQSYRLAADPTHTEHWVCLVRADYGSVTIDGVDRTAIEAFVAEADLGSLLGG